MRILEKLKDLGLASFNRSDHSVESEQQEENTDALASTPGRGGEEVGLGQSHYPPNYVKTDDGRPRH
jgi:hypothetical protein